MDAKIEIAEELSEIDVTATGTADRDMADIDKLAINSLDFDTFKALLISKDPKW